jgi:hypothetical protein
LRALLPEDSTVNLIDGCHESDKYSPQHCYP